MAIAALVLAAAPVSANAAVLNFFGFGFSKSKYYKETQYWVSAAGDVLGIVGVIAPPAAGLGAVIKTGDMILRVIDPAAATIISGRATIGLSTGETFVQGGWYGEFGADPLLPAPVVGSPTISDDALQTACNPLMVSCDINYDAMTHRVVLEFDWGMPGFTPSMNMNSSGHFNFAAIYTLSATENVSFGMIGTREDVATMGIDAPTYMLCNQGYCGDVPEPASVALMITGLGALLMAARTRRSRVPAGATRQTMSRARGAG